MTFLNTAVSATFREASERLKGLIKQKGSRDEAVMELVREFAIESKNVRYDGNGYSQEWRDEAARRGLPVLNSTAEALEIFKQPKATEFLTKENVLSSEEITSRYHIMVERYIKTIDIEIDTLLELVQTYVVPTVEKQLTKLHHAHQTMTLPSLKTKHMARIANLQKTLEEILTRQEELVKLVEQVQGLHDEGQRMKKLASEVQPLSYKLREACDAAEKLVADELWPLPKYREMLFTNSLS